MCLSSLKRFRAGNVGYKLGTIDGETLRTPHENLELPFDTWVSDKSREILMTEETGRAYKAGFHIYLSEHDAKESYLHRYGATLTRCQFAEVVQTGIQYGQKVVVARRIKVLKP